jgi:hypothetical protein
MRLLKLNGTLLSIVIWTYRDPNRRPTLGRVPHPDHDAFKVAFDRLLRDLKAEPNGSAVGMAG